MKNRFTPLLLGTCIAAASFSSISIGATQNIIPEAELSSITTAPWLREYLPEETMLYMRVPSIWGSIASKEDSFKYALGNKNYTNTIKQLQESSAQWVSKSEEKIKPFLALLAGQMSGPIEIAAVVGKPMPSVLLSASVNYENAGQLQQLINSLVKAKIIRGEVSEMVDGAGLLKTNFGPIPYRWDSEKKRLNLLVSFGGSTVAALDTTFSSLTKNPDSPMVANENQVDSSHQGLYAWYNNALAYPTYASMIPKKIKQQMMLAGVPQMKSLALGWGVRNEKGRIKVMLEAPLEGLVRTMNPTNHNKLDVLTAGEPSLVALLALPSLEDFTRIEKQITAMSRDTAPYIKLKADIKTKLGFGIEDILSAFGPEIVAISDDAGEYSAVRIQNKAAFEEILTKLKAQAGVSITEHKIANSDVSYLQLPSMFSDIDKGDMKEVPFFIKDFLTKIKTHVYWQLEGDFLILSELPQILLDRQMQLSDKTVNDWLIDTQKQNLSASTIAISGSMKQAPRRLYYTYLNAIQAVADITQTKIDTFSLPSAKQLALAEKGTLGLQFDSGDSNISFELTFESTPADILLSSQGIASVAGLGILSAIALPAYQDYTFRAKSSAALVSASSLKIIVAEAFVEKGRFPNAQELVSINDSITNTKHYSLKIEPDSGKIVINFVKKYSKRIELTPTAKVDSIHWSCSTNLSNGASPKTCRSPLNED